MTSRQLLWVERLIAWAMAALFLAAALPKIAEPDAFAQVIHAYRLLPDAAINLLAVFLPWIELTAALALLGAPAWRRAGLWLCLLMLTVFTLAQTVNIFRGVKGTCGCFGSASKPIGWTGVAMNAGFLVAGMAGLRMSARRGVTTTAS